MSKKPWCTPKTLSLVNKYKNDTVAEIIERNKDEKKLLPIAHKFIDMCVKSKDYTKDPLYKEAKAFKQLCNMINKRKPNTKDIIYDLYAHALVTIFSKLGYNPENPKLTSHVKKQIRDYGMQFRLETILYDMKVDDQLPPYVFGLMEHMMKDNEYKKHPLYKNVKQFKSIIDGLRKDIPKSVWIPDEYGDIMFDSKSEFNIDYDVYNHAITSLLGNIQF